VVTTETTTARKPWTTLVAHLPLTVCIALLAVPTLITLSKQVWSTEAGAHGPIVLATGLWLLWRRGDALRVDGHPGVPVITALMILAALAIYVFGRAYDFISLEVLGVYGVSISIIHSFFGFRPMFVSWFPLFYLGFLIPPPGWLIDGFTAPLKEFVSYAATSIIELMGIPIAREGVSLVVAQYQLLVEDACSGMNSLIGLIAISLFYIYLARNASWRYSLFLLSLVIPIAIFANILRVVVLVLLTYFFGDAVAQGFMHDVAGLFLFATALVLVFTIDHLLAALLRPRKVSV
jgi:exosortase